MPPPPLPVRRSPARGLVVGCFCLAAALAQLGGEVLPLGAVRASDLGSDYGLLTWNLWSTTEAARHGESLYRTRLLFHPLGANLASHTLGPGFVPIGLAVRLVLGGRADYPLYAHRLAILACFWLGMLLAFAALRALGADAASSLAAAAGWAFAAVWAPFVANQTLVAAGFLVPAVTLAVATLVRRPSISRAALVAVIVGCGPYFSEYFGAFVPLALGTAAAALVASAEGRRALGRILAALRARGLAVVAAAGVLAALPMLHAWSQGSGRPPKEHQLVVGGANLAGFFVPDPGWTPVYRCAAAERLRARVTRGSAPFLGFATLALSAVGAFATRGSLRRVLLAVAAVFLVLSLGPVLRVLGTNTGVPLPYALLARVPPFTMARAPARLAAFAVWALVCLAALGLTALRARASRRFGRTAGLAVAGLAMAVWMVEGHAAGEPPVRVTPPPGLASLPPGAVVDLPLSVNDGMAMFLQIYHGRPIVTGYVSRETREQYEHVAQLQALLDADPVRFAGEVRRFGVRTAILHPGASDAEAEVLAASGLHVVDLRDGLALEPTGPSN
jgi:hypothetical protein